MPEYITKEQFMEFKREFKKEFKELFDFVIKMDKKLDVHIAIAKTLEEQDEKHENNSRISKNLSIGIISAVCSILGTVIIMAQF